MDLIDINSKVVAVDFDGTIVENAYPKIGEEMLFAFATMKELQRKGYKLILWTFRTGRTLDDAVEYCRQNGVEFFAVNENFPGEMNTKGYSRKLNADIFIDDRNVGGFLGWSKIWELLNPENKMPEELFVNPEAHTNYKKSSKGGLFRRRK